MVIQILLRVLLMICSRLSRSCFDILNSLVLQRIFSAMLTPFTLASFSRNSPGCASLTSAIRLLHHFVYLLPTDLSLIHVLRKSGIIDAAVNLYTSIFNNRNTVTFDQQLLDHFQLLEGACVGYFVGEKDPVEGVTLIENMLLWDPPSSNSEEPVEICMRPSLANIALPIQSPQALLSEMSRNANGADGIEDGEAALPAELLRQLAELSDKDSLSQTPMKMKSLLRNLPCVLHLLERIEDLQNKEDIDHCKVASELFMRSLRVFLTIHVEDNDTTEEPQRMDKQISAVILAFLQQHLPMPVLLRDGSSILRLLLSFVETFSESLERHDDIDLHIHRDDKPIAPRKVQEIQSLETDIEESFQETDDDESFLDLLRVVFDIILAILSLGSNKRSPEEESLIKQLLFPLQRIAFNLSRELRRDKLSFKMQQSAQDVALLIIHRHLSPGEGSVRESTERGGNSAKETFFTTLRQVTDSGDENRAVNIAYQIHRSIALLKDIVVQAEELSSDDVLQCLELLTPLLDDTDSYIYLNCLLMLKQLALFCFQHGDNSKKANPTLHCLLHRLIADYSGAELGIPIRRKAMIGELLLLVVRQVRRSQQSPQSAPLSSLLTVRAVLPSLKTACMTLARQRLSDEQRKLVDESTSQDSLQVEMRRAMTIRVQSPSNPNEESNKDSKQKNASTASVPQPSLSSLNAVLESSDCVVLRQSALSLLAELMLLLRVEPLPFSSSLSAPSASNHAVLSLSEVLDIAHGVLRMDTSSAQSAVACRRSAAFLLGCLVMDLGESLLSPAPGSGGELLEAYRALKLAAQDKDSVVKLHAETALDWLGQAVRGSFEEEEVGWKKMLHIVG